MLTGLNPYTHGVRDNAKVIEECQAGFELTCKLCARSSWGRKKACKKLSGLRVSLAWRTGPAVVKMSGPMAPNTRSLGISRRKGTLVAEDHMWATVFMSPGELSFRQVPMPEVGADDLLVKINTALICGTDIKTYKRGHPK